MRAWFRTDIKAGLRQVRRLLVLSTFREGVMFSAPVRPFVPPQFGIKLATERWESDASRRCRQTRVCHEQASSPGAIAMRRPIAQTIVAVDYVMGMTITSSVRSAFTRRAGNLVRFAGWRSIPTIAAVIRSRPRLVYRA